jgi:outer membrane receptor protein involved in Fe transport
MYSLAPTWRFDWLLGGYYAKRKGDRWVNWTQPGYNDIYVPLGADPIPDENLFTATSSVDQEELSFFGELTFNVTDSIKATAGVRHYDIDNRTAGFFGTGLFGTGTELEPSDSQVDFQGEQYRFNLSWSPSDETLLYAQAAQGFRPGSALSRPAFLDNPVCAAELEERGLLPFPTQIDPDELWNYEIGTKLTMLDRRVVLNAAVYEIEWTGIPQRLFLDCGQSFTTNVGAAESRGVEVELQSALTERLLLDAAISYTDATLSDDAPEFDAEAGDRLQEVPQWQVAVGATYTYEISDGWRGTAHLDAQYVGSSYFDFDTTDPALEKGDLTLLNGSFAVESGDWRITLFARNLLNNQERQSLAESLVFNIPGRPRYVINQPRTFGVGVSRRF